MLTPVEPRPSSCRYEPETGWFPTPCRIGRTSGSGDTGGTGPPGRLVLTRRGRLLANEVAIRLQTDGDDRPVEDQDPSGPSGPEL